MTTLTAGPELTEQTGLQSEQRVPPVPRHLAIRIRLLRLQYWYDRLDEVQRLLVGLAVIAFLGASLLYVLGLGSMVLVSRLEPEESVVEQPRAVLEPTPAPTTSVISVAPRPSATATATPAVEAAGELIQPPEVPEVAIIPAPPRILEPVQPIKPRVVAATPTLVRPTAPPASPAPARPNGVAPAAPTNGPTSGPASKPTSAPAANKTSTPATAPQAAKTATPTPAKPPTAAPARAPVNTPALPPLVPVPTPRR